MIDILNAMLLFGDEFFRSGSFDHNSHSMLKCGLAFRAPAKKAEELKNVYGSGDEENTTVPLLKWLCSNQRKFCCCT